MAHPWTSPAPQPRIPHTDALTLLGHLKHQPEEGSWQQPWQAAQTPVGQRTVERALAVQTKDLS